MKKPPPIKNPKYNSESFAAAARLIHGNRYDYSLIQRPILSRTNPILCHDHGIFFQKGQHHLAGAGCKTCGINARSSTSSFGFQKVKQEFQAPAWATDAAPLLGDKVQFTCNNHGTLIVSRYKFDRLPKCQVCAKDEYLATMPEWKRYHYHVWSITEKSWKSKRGFIDHYGHTRGRFDYHLDHQYSVKQGFEDNIPPEIIGHWTNLWLLPYKENLSKHANCSITKELLFRNYYWAVGKFEAK